MTRSIGGSGVLAVPDGWLVDLASAHRLARQLEEAPAEVSGIATGAGPLPPGTSYRVHSERCSLLAPSSARLSAELSVAGAVLLRDGIGWSASMAGIEVERGPLMVDDGAYAHDPDQPIGRVVPADPADRPPFPWRPVVAFVALDPDGTTRNEWARLTVEALMGADIEGRLAMAAPPEGRHLTRPCAPDDASVAALAPHSVVALDSAALEAAQHSVLLGRGTTIIELAPEVDGIELVSWQLGRAAGRLRARVGVGVSMKEFAVLVRRLAAGPQPAPPTLPFAAPSVARVVLMPRATAAPPQAGSDG